MIRIRKDTPFPEFVLAHNLFADKALVRLDLEIEPHADLQLPEARARLADWLAPDPPVLDDDFTVVMLVGRLATWLQSQCGHAVQPVTPRTHIALDDTALFAWEDTVIGRAAGELAVALVDAALTGTRPRDMDARLEAFRNEARSRRLSAVQRAMLQAAGERDIPVLRLQQAPFNPASQPVPQGELLQFGLGCRQHRSQGLLCDTVAPDALRRAAEPRLLVEALIAAGLPVWRGSPDLATDRFRALVIGAQPVAVLRLESGSFVEDTGDAARSVGELATRAAATAELPVAAVDLGMTDEGVCIAGVHPQPALAALEPVAGRVGRAFVDWLVPDATASRIPLAAVTGTNGKTTSCRMLNQILRQGRRTVAMTGTDYTQIGDERPSTGDQAGAGPALSLLQDRRVEAGVLEYARGGLVKQGMGLDGVTVAACTSLTGDHVGQDGVHTFEDMMTVKGQVVRAACEIIILNADDENSLAMEHFARAPVRYLVTMRNDVTDLIKTAECVFHTGDREGQEHLMCSDVESTVALMASRAIPATLDGRVRHNIQNALFAVAMATALGCDADRIRAGLGEFRSDWGLNPGRLNLYEVGGFTVVEDYGHNVNGYQAVFSTLGEVFPDTRRIGVFQLNGNRSDNLIRAAARQAAGVFDEYICAELPKLRREVHGEVMGVIRDALVAEGVQPDRVHLILDPDEALCAALGMAREGDVVAVMGRKDAEARDIIRAWPNPPARSEAS